MLTCSQFSVTPQEADLIYPDPLGCYRVGDLKFYSKLDAIDAMQKTKIHLHWDFNEAAYSCYDWKVEPLTSILELYRRRAEQIRNKYDYIILHYSGGADSQTVLDSFINNGIHVDETVSWINYDSNFDKNSSFNSEAIRVAIPKMKKIQEKFPRIKHRVLDLTSLVMRVLRNDSENRYDWFRDMNSFFNVTTAGRESFGLKVPEWVELIESGKRVCHLYGFDKPRILHINGKFVFRFIDFVDSGPTIKSMAGQQPYTDEFFYWSPELPEIVIKQAHLIKNYLSRDVTKLPFVSKQSSGLAYKEVNGEKHWLSNHGVHSLIYPNWDITTYSYGKTSSILFTDKEVWLREIERENPLKKVWWTGLEKLWQSVPDYWKNNPQDISSGLVSCWSKDYFLE